MANFGVIFRKWRQFSQCVYIQSFRVAKNHSHKKAIKTHLDASLYDTDGGPYYTVITFDYESIHQDI